MITAILLVLSLFSPEFQPVIFTSDGRLAILLSAVLAGLAIGLFEEIGWTGFAVPRLKRRYSVLYTGLTDHTPALGARRPGNSRTGHR